MSSPQNLTVAALRGFRFESMSENTKIEWADHSWSPWRGCTKVSPGCANCYAETLSKRNPAVLGQWGKGKSRVLAKNWGDPVRWNSKWEHGKTLQEAMGPEFPLRRLRIFPSLCDWLDDEVSPSWLAEFMALINLTPHLNWLLLTKRLQNWREMIDAAALASTPFHQRWLVEWLKGNPPPNVWFGVSVEDQQRADERIPLLLQIPAKVRWLSLEPLLGPVDLEMLRDGSWYDAEGANKYDALRGIAYWLQHGNYDHGLGGGPKLDWLVVGGESGRGARNCDVKWVQSILEQARTARVPVFVKQLGSRPFRSWDNPPGNTIPEIASTIGEGWTLEHPKGGDPLEWPTDLRVREFPTLEA